MYRHLLVPLDTSQLAECVLPHVGALARAWPIVATLLHVIDPAAAADAGGFDPLRSEVERERADAYLHEIASRLEGEGVEARVVVAEGAAADVIVRTVREEAVDLVALSSHGRSGLRGFNVGSVGHKVFTHARAAMLVARAFRSPAGGAAGAAGYRSLLVPLDGSPRAECVLAPVAAVARAHDSEVQVCHIVCRPELARRMPLSPEEAALVDRVVAVNLREAEAYVADVSQRLAEEGVRARGYVMQGGQATTALHDLVARIEPDLLVLSAHGYSGGARWPFGSTVLSFLTFGTTPLLVIQDLERADLEPTEAQRYAQQRPGH